MDINFFYIQEVIEALGNTHTNPFVNKQTVHN